MSDEGRSACEQDQLHALARYRRLVRFLEENRDTVSHIEITASREEAAQIYANLLSESPRLADYVGTLITFGLP